MLFKKPTDYNKLGQIYEASLEKYRRKRGGIFYTPNHITKYIVENTIGKLCQNKKTDLQISDGKTTPEQLEKYQNWLLELTICDPACGAGAFLNQAYEFLIYEHELILKLGGKNIDYEYFILKNNLFGVDVNEESVEIAQLSLWLHTARRGRKLTTLSNNIKCGNSLIDDPKIAGEKAFDWEKEFPQIFEKGGFDVVIGNPPYVQLQKMDSNITSVFTNYQSYNAMGDIYALFYEKGIQILNHTGLLSLITSSKWMKAKYGKNLRQFLAKNLFEMQLIEFSGYQIFEDATVDTNILTGRKSKNTNQNFGVKIKKDFEVKTDISIYFEKCKIPLENLSEKMWENISLEKRFIKNKIHKKGIPLKSWDIKINFGIKTGFNQAFMIDKTTKERLIQEDSKSAEIIRPLFRGRDIQRYQAQFADFYLICTFPSLHINIENYPAVKIYLQSFGSRLHQTGQKGSRKKTNHQWFETQDSIGYWKELQKEKIAWKRIGSQLRFSYASNGHAYLDSTCILTGSSVKYLLTFLNSKLCNWMLHETGQRTGVGDLIISVQSLEPLPVPKISSEDQQPFIQRADKILLLNSDLQKVSSKFLKLLQAQFSLDKVSKKLQKWHELEFEGFLKELKKAKVKLSLADKSEWMDFFEAEKTKAQTLQSEIQKVDSEIDQMVYQLYGLTEEEIKIVENN